MTETTASSSFGKNINIDVGAEVLRYACLFSIIFRRAHEKSGLTQREAARQAGISKSCLGRILNGWAWNVQLVTLAKLSKVYGIHLKFGTHETYTGRKVRPALWTPK